MSDYAVLGCGPAGLLAAYAARESGHHVAIYSIKKRSPMGGAQYLHRSIPGLASEEPDAFVEFRKIGSREMYAHKLYADRKAPCSWDNFSDDDRQPAWSMRAVYDKLWEEFDDSIVNKEITPEFLDDVVADYDKVISTIPASLICDAHRFGRSPHNFRHVPIWISRTAPEFLPENTVVYDGTAYTPWYRASRIFGEPSCEFRAQPAGDDWNLDEMVRGYKPLDTDCDCRPEIMRVGRFGKWQRGVLTHHAWEEVSNALQPV